MVYGHVYIQPVTKNKNFTRNYNQLFQKTQQITDIPDKTNKKMNCLSFSETNNNKQNIIITIQTFFIIQLRFTSS